MYALIDQYRYDSRSYPEHEASKFCLYLLSLSSTDTEVYYFASYQFFDENQGGEAVPRKIKCFGSKW